MTVSECYEHFLKSLGSIYDDRESRNITDWLFESTAGLKRSAIVLKKSEQLSGALESTLHLQLEQLKQHMPLQYVLGESFFCKMKFKVNDSVLIPRPETEELVEWICTFIRKENNQELRLLEIGSGSGCIPVSIKKNIPSCVIQSIDISSSAIAVATENAQSLETDVDFLLLDFLDKNQWTVLGNYDLIVSNPPYIPSSEMKCMARHVVDFEPHEALFVPQEDPLIFYKTIKEFGEEHLNRSGNIFAEIHENQAESIINLFSAHTWNIEIKKDLYGRDRMMRAWRN